MSFSASASARTVPGGDAHVAGASAAVAAATTYVPANPPCEMTLSQCDPVASARNSSHASWPSPSSKS